MRLFLFLLPFTSLLQASDRFLVVLFGVHLTNTANPPDFAAPHLWKPARFFASLSLYLSVSVSLFQAEVVLRCFTADRLWQGSATCSSLAPPEWLPGAFSNSMKMEKEGRKYIIFLF